MTNQVAKKSLPAFLVLTIICLVAALALAATNAITKGPIAEHAMAAQREAFGAVMAADEYAEMTIPEGSGISALVEAKKDGQTIGYCVVASTGGYAGPVAVTLGVDLDGVVTGAKIGDTSFAETSGFGSRWLAENQTEQFVGISLKDGGAIEKKAKEIFGKTHDIPVVCGYELFSELNSLRRGASTLLNAGLFPVIREFLESVKKALAIRGIHPSALVIVRSDGSLMSEEFAALRPVETLLCGPAASAIGCTHLTGEKNCIVVDMGGTTTDIALIRDGKPVPIRGGVSIGRWKTFVNGLYVRTFGLGGDTAVHYEGRKLYLEEYRVTPLCVAAAEYPSVTENLRRMEPKKHTRFLYEHYMLIRDIEDSTRYTEDEKTLCRVLRERPLPIAEAAAAAGKDIYSLRPERLIHDGVIQLCGFTPTDVMHLQGDFTKYDAEASRLGAEFIAHNLECSVDDICTRVYDEVKKKMYVNIIKALLENRYPDYMKNGFNPDVERFILSNYEAGKSGVQNEMLSAMFRTEYALVGMGGPIRVFLDDVAELLGTRAVLPENHEVANALGAIMGNVSVTVSIEILPDNSPEGTVGHIVYGKDGRTFFKDLPDAIAFARKEAEERAVAEAGNRGAVGEISVTSSSRADDAEMRDGAVYLGTVVTACASGSMGF